MFLRKQKTPCGRLLLSIARSFREHGKPRYEIVEKLGYLDELEKTVADPIAYYTQLAKERTKQDAAQRSARTLETMLSVSLGERLTEGISNRKNMGYAVLSKVYHELGLHTFMKNHSQHSGVKYNVNNIMKLLIFERILNPASKEKTWKNRARYLEHTDFTLDDVYRCLSLIHPFDDDIQTFLHEQVVKQYGRKTELVYYDVTNYYFEVDEQDNMRRKGVSKEHRPNPIIQMGLFTDTMGLPISYGLFPGNTNDCETLIPILRQMKQRFNMDRAIVVADKGMNCSDNIAFNILHGDGYVFSQTIRGGNKELKAYALNPDGYRAYGEDYKIKSRIYPRIIYVTDIAGGKKKVDIDEKQVIFYSRDYDRRAKAEREGAVQKARELAANPARFNRASSYGAAKYVKNLAFDPKTGEILTSKCKPIFDEARLREEEKYDGYYSIVSSELEKTDEEIIDLYKGLWKIEESFRVTKSDLVSRPVYLDRQDRIASHFMICFIALLIARIVQLRLRGKFSVSAIADSLNRASCTHMGQNLYVFDHTDAVIEAVRDNMGIDLTRRFQTQGQIKKMLAESA
jgi:hypothetical protein